MLQLIKLTNVKYILEVISNKDAFFQILVCILQLNSKDLIQLFKNLFDHIKSPPSLLRKLKEDEVKPDKTDAKSTEKK